MRINRLELRKAGTDALAADRAAHDRRIADWNRALEQHQQEWADRHGDHWRGVAKTIMARLRKGEPIYSADLRRGYNDVTYSEPYSLGDIRRPDREYLEPRELATLGKMLDAITDDEVTPSGLRSLGVTSATLRDAITQLGRAGR